MLFPEPEGLGQKRRPYSSVIAGLYQRIEREHHDKDWPTPPPQSLQPTPPPQSLQPTPPPPRQWQPPSAWKFLRWTITVISLFIVVVKLTQPSESKARIDDTLLPYAPLYTGNPLPYRDVAFAVNTTTTVFYTLQKSTLSPSEIVLPRISHLRATLLHCVRKIDALNSHTTGELTYSMKLAVKTSQGAGFSRMQTAVLSWQNLTNQVVDCLSKSHTQHNSTISRCLVQRSDLEEALATYNSAARTRPWNPCPKVLSATDLEEALAISICNFAAGTHPLNSSSKVLSASGQSTYRETKDWLSLLGNVTKDLRVNNNTIILALTRYTRLQRDIQFLTEKLGKTHTSRYSTPELKNFEQVFLAAVSRAIGEDTEVDEFRDKYHVL